MKMLVGALLLVPALAVADQGADVLKVVDDHLNSFKDGTWETKLLVREPGSGSAREFQFTTYQKVPNKRLVRFSAPGDVKGMGFLVENPETMYAFLPGFQKIRRLGTHIKNQTFMGSDLSFDDMSQTRFGNIYEAKLASQDDKSWTLEMTAKSGLDLEFPKARMVVDKKMNAPTKIDFMDASGKLLKTQERDQYVNLRNDYWAPNHIVFIDHRRNDHTSELIFTSTKLDTSLTDDLFSQRSLIRGQ
jgi:outer membrane lipoprotein-sorting protein